MHEKKNTYKKKLRAAKRNHIEMVGLLEIFLFYLLFVFASYPPQFGKKSDVQHTLKEMPSIDY